MLSHVMAPTTPSTAMPFSCWKARTAASVAAPNSPSIGPGSWPASLSACCSWRTSVPLEPRLSTGSAMRRPFDSWRGCRPSSEREHPADQRAPGDRADDAVDSDAEGLLEAPDGLVGLGPEDPVDLDALRRIAGQVAELELHLDAADGVAGAAAPDRDDDGGPRLRTDDPVGRESAARLHGAHGGLRHRPEHAVHRDVVSVGPKELLQRQDRVALVAVPADGPRLDRIAHCCSLCSRAGGFAGDRRNGCRRASSAIAEARVVLSRTVRARGPEFTTSER